jgi:hypothetical protein
MFWQGSAILRLGITYRAAAFDDIGDIPLPDGDAHELLRDEPGDEVIEGGGGDPSHAGHHASQMSENLRAETRSLLSTLTTQTEIGWSGWSARSGVHLQQSSKGAAPATLALKVS